MKNALLIGLVGVLVSVCAVAADVPQPIEMPVKDFRAGIGLWGGLCGNLKVPCGYMAAEGDPETRQKEAESKLKSMKFKNDFERAQKFQDLKVLAEVKSGTARDALQRITERDPRYEWTTENGIVNILPKKGQRHLENGEDPLERRIKNVEISNEPSVRAAHIILQASGLPVGGRIKAGPREHYAAVSLKLKGVTLREALNELVKADGMASWGLEYTEYKNYVVDIYSWRKGPGLLGEQGKQKNK